MAVSHTAIHILCASGSQESRWKAMRATCAEAALRGQSSSSVKALHAALQDLHNDITPAGRLAEYAQ